ncbi:MAG TPA: hypothetical protein VGW78_05435 [Candidatus Babeliales bacterium]|jgi:hypothetical protein|nr:hypothetical protein [Candidatus Babeliales bacterium]
MRILANTLPLILHGYFGVGQHSSDIPVCQYTLSKKPHKHFYASGLAYAKQVVGDTDNTWAYIYIDDKASHIHTVRAYARELNMPIIAIHYLNSQQLQEDMRFVCGI